MPIQSIEQGSRIPILGTIRLGVKVKTQSGHERPDNADHFVLHDAPGVAEVYGAAPKELDITFPSDDLADCAPSWLQWWRPGAKDKNGKAISGILRCKGNGPDEKGNPGVAQYFDKRDLKTGLVPTRPCMAQGCSDWLDAKGNPQCKPGMQIYVILPKVSVRGVYKLSTTSWTTISDLYAHLKWLQKFTNGRIAGSFFKMVKEQHSFSKFDANGKEQKIAQWVVKFKPNEVQAETQLLVGAFNSFAAQLGSWSAPPQQLEAPIHDVPQLEGQVEDTAQKLSAAEELLNDEEVKRYFARLEQLLGAPVTPKDRLILARKHEKKENPKQALLAAITEQAKSLSKAQPAPAQAPEPEPAPAPAPVVEAAAPAPEQQQVEPVAAAPADGGGLI